MKFTLEKAIELLDEEIKYAKGMGMPQFVLGLQQAKVVISHLTLVESSKPLNSLKTETLV